MRKITLRTLWEVFRRSLLVIVLAALVGMDGLHLYSSLLHTPQYSSTATMYILYAGEDGPDYDDFSVGLKVAQACAYWMTSRSVLNEVIQGLGLNRTAGELLEMVQVENPEDTRILEVTVRGDSPELAKEIVDALCLAGQEKITRAMGVQEVSVVEEGTLESEPCNDFGWRAYALAGLATAAAAYGVCLLWTLYRLEKRAGCGI